MTKAGPLVRPRTYTKHPAQDGSGPERRSSLQSKQKDPPNSGAHNAESCTRKLTVAATFGTDF